MLTLTADHWLSAARRVASPNCDVRNAAIDLVVIHCISLPECQFKGEFIDALFTNTLDTTAHPSFADLEGLRVSAHLLIRRNGELVQYVPFDKRAWHAGQSAFMGRTACNAFSIGIELEGCIKKTYTDVQYRALNSVLTLLRQHWPAITPDRITGHSDIAPGRKQDPGPFFEWPRIHQANDNT
jgi:AmpD protein